ncbi:hypothetical protein ACFQV4_13905 [Streptomyces thermocarboxydus]
MKRSLASADAVRSAVVVRALGGTRKWRGRTNRVRVVRLAGRHLRAVEVPGATAWAARARNLHILVALLEEASTTSACGATAPGRRAWPCPRDGVPMSRNCCASPAPSTPGT